MRAPPVRWRAVGEPWMAAWRWCGCPGRPPAAGRWSGEGANGRPIVRMRGGVDVLCSVLSWRRKSVTEEFGRFSTRDRSIGGIRTAAQAAATTRRTSWAMSQYGEESVRCRFVMGSLIGTVRCAAPMCVDSTTIVTMDAIIDETSVTPASRRTSRRWLHPRPRQPCRRRCRHGGRHPSGHRSSPTMPVPRSPSPGPRTCTCRTR